MTNEELLNKLKDINGDLLWANDQQAIRSLCIDSAKQKLSALIKEFQ